MPGPVLVTGAAGFAGSHLIDLLHQDGHDVAGWYHSARTSQPAPAGIAWQQVDVLDGDAVRIAIRALRPARVYHCAGAAHVGQAWDATRGTLAVNVMGTHHLIEALRASSPDARVLIPSSALVYQASTDAMREDHPLQPGTPYGLSKLAQELLCRGNQGHPCVYVARPFNHIGPRQNPSFSAAGFAQRIADIESGRCEAEIPVGNLEPLRDITDVRDTVRAYRAILECGVPGRPYNICTGRTVSIREILDRLVARARVPIRVVTDSSRYRPSDQPTLLGDPTRIREELGWIPAISLERTLDDLLDYWRALRA